MKTQHMSYDSSRIIRLWLLGKSAREISLETGASLSTVYRWIRRYGTHGSFTYHVPSESFLCNSYRHNNSEAQAIYFCGNPCIVCLYAGKNHNQNNVLPSQYDCSAMHSLNTASSASWTMYFT